MTSIIELAVLAGLSSADIAILSEPNPYSYDSTITDPSQPPSLFVQVMREEEDKFFAAFPEAKKAAEDRQRRRAQLWAFLASLEPRLFPPVQNNPYCPLQQHKLPHTVPQQQQQQPHSPTLHVHRPHQRQHLSGSQCITSDKLATSTISRDRGSDHSPKPHLSSPMPSSRSSKKRRVGPVPRKRPRKLDGKIACLFCRGRKIACGAPLLGGMRKTCNQCRLRSLQCEFPESRRGMRNRKILNESDLDDESTLSL